MNKKRSSVKPESSLIGRDETLDGNSQEALELSETVQSREGQARPKVAAGEFPVTAWDRYEFERLLGKGGMGAVYQARDRKLGRTVALKFIRGDDAGLSARFMQEARAQSRLSHHNICQVYETGEVEGKWYIAMEYIDGVPLDKASPTLSLHDKIQVIRDVARALHSAHDLGIIHRDIKPSNIMVERVPDGDGTLRTRPVLMDFGLAREASDGKGLTESGAVMGTPAYMSPEQARGDAKRLDRRSDIYSLGASLYDILVGAPPFEDETVVNILLAVMNQEVVPPRKRDASIPEALDAIVCKCLNKEPHQRYSTGEELAADLDRLLSKKQVLAKRLSLLSRLYWRGKRNRPLATAILALCCSALGFVGYGIRTAITTARKERVAKQRTELAQKLGQAIKDLEWLVRTSYMLPLHDTGSDKAVVRDKMKTIETEMRSFGDLAAGLDHYALGRGFLALQDWPQAHHHLREAELAGVTDLELDYALGRALGERYSLAMDEARRSGDPSFFERRKQELSREFLKPALIHLERCRGLSSVSTNYVEGLIDFYNQQYDAALLHAYFARRNTPWLYEAAKLEGDVLAVQALEQKDRGEYEQSARKFREALLRYEQASEVGRSDHRLYEAIAEVWVRLEEQAVQQGLDHREPLERALHAASQAIEAAPQESYGHTKRAAAWNFEMAAAQRQGKQEGVTHAVAQLIAAGSSGVAVHPDDYFAHDLLGIAYEMKINFKDSDEEAESIFQNANQHYQLAIQYNRFFPWAHNDLGMLWLVKGNQLAGQEKDPMSSYHESEQHLSNAVRIDPTYAFGYGNLAFVNQKSAQWRIEHGQDPSPYVENTLKAATASLAINNRNRDATGNMGLALSLSAQWKLAHGQTEPARADLDLAIAQMERTIALNPGPWLPYRDIAQIHALKAAAMLKTADDLGQVYTQGQRYVEQCRAHNKHNPSLCDWPGSLLAATYAEWRFMQRRDFESDLREALRLAQSSYLARNTLREAEITLGEVTLRMMRLARKAKLPIKIDSTAAQEAIGLLLKTAPAQPKGTALLGALKILVGFEMLDKSQRETTQREGRELIQRAMAINPLLHASFADYLTLE